VIPVVHASVSTRGELYRINADAITKVFDVDFQTCPDGNRKCTYVSNALWLSNKDLAVFTSDYFLTTPNRETAIRLFARVIENGGLWKIQREQKK
jgi:hypothetical protein